MNEKPERSTVPPDTVRRIRGIFRERKALPTDAELAQQTGLSVRMVRAIGSGLRYAGVPDVEPCQHPNALRDHCGTTCPDCGYTNAFPWECPKCGQCNAGWATHCGRCESNHPD